MSDIVERLREGAGGLGSWKTDRGDYGLLEDAADVIEKLREELSGQKQLLAHINGLYIEALNMRQDVALRDLKTG